MTENTTTTGGSDAESETEFVAVGAAKEEEAALPEELIEIDDDGADDEDDVPGTGTVSGGFGFAGLALAIVSLTTNWTSGIVVSHAQYVQEVHQTSTASAQVSLNMYENGWHTQAWWDPAQRPHPGLGEGGRDRRAHRRPDRGAAGGPDADRRLRRAHRRAVDHRLIQRSRATLYPRSSSPSRDRDAVPAKLVPGNNCIVTTPPREPPRRGG